MLRQRYSAGAFYQSSMESSDKMFESTQSKRAILAGGCFWCMVIPFDEYEGVLKVTSGYTGGHIENPTYEQVKSQQSGHLEAVEILYDPTKISFTELLEVFWQQINPTDDGGQFGDRGDSYRTAIFYTDEAQRLEAEASKQHLAESGKFNKPVVTRILPVQPFYIAEDYHQDYAKKAPEAYSQDFAVKERKQFIHQTWDEPENTPKEKKN